jgi:D-alanyl-lipoteichoic acid acyltransferase DltB (MBOAT superfamily)
MLFHRLDFLLFFVAVLLVYPLLRRRAQNVWLLAASYFFYAMWDWRFLGLLLLSTLVDFLVGGTIEARRGPAKVWLAVSIVVNLGILAAFKYAGFFVESFVNLLASAGLDVSVHVPALILPVGISFYTFQSMSYTIDVYRGETGAQFPSDFGPTVRSAIGRTLSCFVDFALYVAFFPQLVAGPIERSTRLLGQIVRPRRQTAALISQGCWLFALGLVMKIGIADEVAPQVDAAFAHPAGHGLAALYAATLGFAIQIYCDFAGYSYMARGVAAMLGFNLMINFRQPYLARSFSDFWRRWHISLSTWIRDYLYIPLGGNRVSSGRTYVNVLVVMALAGLWHGSAWAFVMWGLLHGAFLALERRFAPSGVSADATTPQTRGNSLLTLVYGLVVFHGVLLGWFLFRIGSLSDLTYFEWDVASAAVASSPLPFPFPEALPFLNFAALFVVYEWPCRRADRELGPREFHFGHRLLLYLTLGAILLSTGGQADAPFIYFQF